MSIIADYTYEIYKADTDIRFIEFFEDEAKTTPFDLSTFSNWIMQVKEHPTRSTKQIELTLGDGLTISDTNKMTFEISKERADIDVNDYTFDLEGDNGAGSDRQTILRGDFIVIQDVTRQ